MSKREAIVQPMILALLIAVGFGLAWGIVVGWGVTIINQVAQAGRPYWYINVAMDGTPVVWRRVSGEGDGTMETLDGERIENKAYEQNLPPATLRSRNAPDPFFDRFRNIGWRKRIYGYLLAGRPAVLWYFVYDGQIDGHGYFVGYENKTKSLVGYIGENGFQQIKPAPEACFPVNGRMFTYQPQAIASLQNSYAGNVPNYYSAAYDFDGAVPGGVIPVWRLYLVSDDRLIEVDLLNRSVRTLLEQEGIVSADILQGVEPYMNAKNSQNAFRDFKRRPDFVAVSSADRVFIVDTEGNVKQSFPIPSQCTARIVYVNLLDNDMALFRTKKHRPESNTWSLFWVNSAGEMVNEREVSFPNYGFPVSKSAEASVLATALPAPAIFGGYAAVVSPLSKLYVGSGSVYSSALAHSLEVAWPMLLAVSLLGVALGWQTWRRQRRFGAAWTPMWVGFVFLFGLPGYVGYRFCRGWPARKPCPACHREAPRDRDACFACGSEFPSPAAKGIEVFV